MLLNYLLDIYLQKNKLSYWQVESLLKNPKRKEVFL